MVTEPRFLLTTKDHAILQALHEQQRGPHGPFQQLLGRKLRSSAIAFSGDIPPGVVTLGSRITYRVDGRLLGPHVLVQSEAAGLPDFAVSIHTLRGLALLGLAERGALTLDLGNGAVEELRVEDVLSQPEAEARLRDAARTRPGVGGGEGTIVSFRQKVAHLAPYPSDPDDDDPGPRAA